MLLMPVLRSMVRYSRGQRPRRTDLDEIIVDLRDRRRRGAPIARPRLGSFLRRLSWGDPAERIRALQTRKLRNTIEYVYRYVPYYREALDARGLSPSDIRSLDDVQKLPITHRRDLELNLEAFISRQPGLEPTIPAATTGTTGKRLVTYLTSDELHYYAAAEAIAGLASDGIGPRDIVHLSLPLERSVATLIATTAGHMAGALVLNRSYLNSMEEHVASIFRQRSIPGKKSQVSALFCSPSYLWALTREVESMDLDFADAGVERIMTGGATVSEALKARVVETWGLELSEGFAMVEAPSLLAFLCPEGRYHFVDYTGYAEVLDPETEEPVPPGQAGVLALTTFYPDRELMPFLRYWSQDLVVAGGDWTCPCGATSTQILEIVGRADEVVFVGSGNLYPQMLGDSLLAFPELVMPPRFRVSNEERGGAPLVILDVEVAASLTAEEEEQLRQRIFNETILGQSWHAGVQAIQVVVNLRPADSIDQPFSYKYVDYAEAGDERQGQSQGPRGGQRDGA